MTLFQIDQYHIAIDKLLALRIGLGNMNYSGKQESLQAMAQENLWQQTQLNTPSHCLTHIPSNTLCA
jgi:hypothetical protein